MVSVAVPAMLATKAGKKSGQVLQEQFGYNFIDENGLDKSHYEEEINAIVKQQVERAIKLEVAEANLRENT